MKKLLLFFFFDSSGSFWSSAQVARNMVAVEITTSTLCTYCPGAALGLDDSIFKRLQGCGH